MSTQVLIAAGEIIFALVLIARVLTSYRRSSMHLLFSAMLLCLVIWIGGAALGSLSSEYEVVLRWFKFCSFGFIFLHAFTLHLTLVYTGRSPRTLALRLLIYLPSVAFFIISLNRLVVFEDFFKRDGLWMGIPAYGDPVFYALVTHYSLYYLLVFLLLYRRIRMTARTREKRQGIIILVSILITELLFNIDPFVLPALLGRPAFMYAQLYSIIWMVGIWIALRYYRLLDVYPGRLFEQVLSQISDLVIFVDLDMRVVFANELARQHLLPAADTGAALSPRLNQFMICNPSARKELAAFIESGQQTGSIFTYFGPDAHKHLWRCRLTRIHDRFNDCYGVLIIMQNLASAKALKEQFGLSERELEVVSLVVDDRTNGEIAQTLGITQRTVKAHLTHIFIKTRTKNRVGLVNLVYGQE